MESQLKKETQKFAFVSRAFLFKTMECIYQVRCREQVTDFSADEESWFFMNIEKSLSLRQKISSTSYHGWFSIDIAISNTGEIVERWYLIHLPVKQTDTVPSLNTNLKELKLHTYRHFSQILRSIYSMANCLPAATLSYYFKQFKTVKRTLVGNISAFQKFPAKIESFCEEETANIKFGPIVTPVGKTLVICQHRVDITPLIPSPIRTAPHYVFPRAESPPLQEHLSESHVDTYGQSISSSLWNMTPLPAVNIQSFVPESINDDHDLGESLMENARKSARVLPIDDFMHMLDNMGEYPTDTNESVEDVMSTYEAICKEIQDLSV